MTEDAKRNSTETIPSVAGTISALASAHAQFIYFEGAPFFGLVGGVGKIVLVASRQMATTSERAVLSDHVVAAHLVGSPAAMRALRAAIDGILLMAEPKPDGPAN
jgi:hypothetical protein